MRSLFSFPLGLPRSRVFPLPRLLLSTHFPSWLAGLSRAPPPGLSGFLEVGRSSSWGWGTRFCLGDLGDWGKSGGGRWYLGAKGKKRFLHLLSVSQSLLPLSLFLSPSLVKVGRWLGRGEGTLRLSAFGTNQFLHKAESPSPGQWPGCLGMRPLCFLPGWVRVAGPQGQVIYFSGVPTTSSPEN